MELADIAKVPEPVWITDLGEPVILPANPGFLAINAMQAGLLLLVNTDTAGDPVLLNPSALEEHGNIRLTISAYPNGPGITLPATDLRFADDSGGDRIIYLPAVTLPPGAQTLLWVADNGSTYYASPGDLVPDFSDLARGAAVPWTALEDGYRVELVAANFQLPVNIAFAPTHPVPEHEGHDHGAEPWFYVTELYGKIKVVTKDGQVSTYAENLLNFNPTGFFPGSGEQGVTGICVDPNNGDVYATLLYADPAPDGPHYPRVVRFTSNDGGLTAAAQTTVIQFPGEPQGQSHQISSISFGPDGALYVHVGDGFEAEKALDPDSFRGKILRMSPNGKPLSDNPFFNLVDGVNARDYTFALGLRNPFGGAWNAADNQLYAVEPGPSIDRLMRIVAGGNYGWNGTDQSILTNALHVWFITTAPTNIAFIRPDIFAGSGFPPTKLNRAYVTESGPTWASGAPPNGKRIVEFSFDEVGNVATGPTPVAEYNGSGKASAVGLATGPDGLYFTDFYKDIDFVSPIDPGANVLRLRYVGAANFTASVTQGPHPLTVQFTDLSEVPEIRSWKWEFGNGATSTLQNPTYTYTSPGVYNVRLTLTGPTGLIVKQKNGYIRVGKPPRVALIGDQFPPTGADALVEAWLTTAGFEVTAYPDERDARPSATALAGKFDAVLVSGTIDPNNIDAEFRTVAVPLVFWKPELLSPTREALAWSYGIAPSYEGFIQLQSVSHPITQGLPTTPIPPYSSPTDLGYALGPFGPGTEALAIGDVGGVNAALLVAESGAALVNGLPAPARRVFFYPDGEALLFSTTETLALLQRSACWACGAAPSVVTIAGGGETPSGGSAVLQVGAGGASPLSYQWERDGAPLADGDGVSGANTATLTLSNVVPADAGFYRCRLSNLCGAALSPPINVSVDGGCLADINRDNLIDESDLALLLNSYGNCGAQGCPGDFDNDGDVDDSDLATLLLLFGSSCTE